MKNTFFDREPRSPMQKLFAIVCLVLFSILVVITGLDSQPHPVTLRLIVPEDTANQFAALIDEFEATHKNIHIELANRKDKPENPGNSAAVRKHYIKAFKEKKPYDLVYMDVIWVSEFANNLLDLTKFQNEPEFQGFLPKALENGFYEGRLYRIPIRYNIGMLYYRKDLLNAIHRFPPKTLEELQEAAQEIQHLPDDKKIKRPYVWQGRYYEGISAAFVEILKSYEGFWIREKQIPLIRNIQPNSIDPNQSSSKYEVGLGKQRAIDAVMFLRDTLKENGISPNTVVTSSEKETSDLFLRGQAAFVRHWPNLWNNIIKSDSPVLGQVIVQPMIGGATDGSWGLGIAKETKHHEEALEALKFFTSAEVQRKFVLEEGDLPSREMLFTDPLIVRKYNYYPELYKKLKNENIIANRPAIPQYPCASSILQKALNQALTDSIEKRGEIELIMQEAAAETTEKCFKTR